MGAQTTRCIYIAHFIETINVGKTEADIKGGDGTSYYPFDILLKREEKSMKNSTERQLSHSLITQRITRLSALKNPPYITLCISKTNKTFYIQIHTQEEKRLKISEDHRITCFIEYLLKLRDNVSERIEMVFKISRKPTELLRFEGLNERYWMSVLSEA